MTFDEAVAILRWIAQAPGSVRALRGWDDGSYGPLPFDVDFSGVAAEVTFTFTGGMITGLASVRLGERFSNDHDWIGQAEGSPLDELSGAGVAILQASLRRAADRLP